MKTCGHRDCDQPARWRIVGRPAITCDTHRDNALKQWPGATAVPLPEPVHEQQ